MLKTIIAAALSFAATNIDDILVDTLFFVQADTRKKTLLVALGKYLGVGALFWLSLLGAWFLRALPQGYERPLGLLPIALGVKAWLSRDADGAAQAQLRSGTLALSAALVTIANGGDNIGVYMPLLAGYDAAQVIATVAVFTLMTALWCFLGRRLSSLPVLRAFLTRYSRTLVPVVLIALGMYILV